MSSHATDLRSMRRFPLPSIRRHLSYDDCLEDKSEDYQNCSVLYCVPQLYTVVSTHICTVFTSASGTAG